jgi:hypothetical protein
MTKHRWLPLHAFLGSCSCLIAMWRSLWNVLQTTLSNIYSRQTKRTNAGHSTSNPVHTRPFYSYMKTYPTSIYKFFFSTINNWKWHFFNQLVAAPHDSFQIYSPGSCVSILHNSRSNVTVNCLKLTLYFRYTEFLCVNPTKFLIKCHSQLLKTNLVFKIYRVQTSAQRQMILSLRIQVLWVFRDVTLCH